MDGYLPWTRSCFVCGENNPGGLQARLRRAGEQVVIDYTPGDKDRGYRQLMHGGLGMTLLDEVMTWAAILATKRMCVAAEMTTRFVKPVTIGKPLCITGKAEDIRRRMVTTNGAVRDANGNELMRATGKYMAMPDDFLAECRKDFVFDSTTLAAENLFP